MVGRAIEEAKGWVVCWKLRTGEAENLKDEPIESYRGAARSAELQARLLEPQTNVPEEVGNARTRTRNSGVGAKPRRAKV